MRPWARTDDRAGRTASARQAFRDRFEREVDPDGKLDPAERGDSCRVRTQGLLRESRCPVGGRQAPPKPRPNSVSGETA